MPCTIVRHVGSGGSEKGYALDMSIVAKSGEFSKTITYADVIEMSFVKKHKA